MKGQDIAQERVIIPITNSHPNSCSGTVTGGSWLGDAWRSFMANIKPKAPRPRIWQKRDRLTGITRWYCYDPTTAKLIGLMSEQAVIHWLEQQGYSGTAWQQWVEISE